MPMGEQDVPLTHRLGIHAVNPSCRLRSLDTAPSTISDRSCWSSFRGAVQRLSKDYERRTDSSECMVRLRGIQVILNRSEPRKQQPPFHYRVA
jgi:hypothetical protein